MSEKKIGVRLYITGRVREPPEEISNFVPVEILGGSSTGVIYRLADGKTAVRSHRLHPFESRVNLRSDMIARGLLSVKEESDRKILSRKTLFYAEVDAFKAKPNRFFLKRLDIVIDNVFFREELTIRPERDNPEGLEGHSLAQDEPQPRSAVPA
ncbi:MAG: hypothetical protein ACE5OZ_11405 [Candidatus Heimdallarchaeota archaeon]